MAEGNGDDDLERKLVMELLAVGEDEAGTAFRMLPTGVQAAIRVRRGELHRNDAYAACKRICEDWGTGLYSHRAAVERHTQGMDLEQLGLVKDAMSQIMTSLGILKKSKLAKEMV